MAAEHSQQSNRDRNSRPNSATSGCGSQDRLTSSAGAGLKFNAPFLVLLALLLAASPRAHGAASNQVTVRIEGNQRIITANGWPDHAPGTFPRRGNPNTLSPQHYTFRVPLKPVAADTPTRRGGWFFGVALNGVPFEPGTAETWNGNPAWRYEAHTGFMNLGLDEHNAHVQPTGAYHYHAMPIGLVDRLGGDTNRMRLVGWAADGFPIYTARGHADPKDASSPLKKMRPGFRLKQGERPGAPEGPGGRYDGRFTQDFEFVEGSGDLDECNGRVGVTPEFPEGIYHYYITEEFPFLPRQWRGTPDSSFGKGGGPPGGGRRGGPPGTGRGPGGPGGGPMPSPIIDALDANGDGTIDSDELQRAGQLLRSLDVNGDGQLTPDEFQPARPGGPRGPGDDRPRGRPGPRP